MYVYIYNYIYTIIYICIYIYICVCARACVCIVYLTCVLLLLLRSILMGPATDHHQQLPGMISHGDEFGRVWLWWRYEHGPTKWGALQVGWSGRKWLTIGDTLLWFKSPVYQLTHFLVSQIRMLSHPIPSSVSKSWRFSQFFLMFLFKSPPDTLISLISNYSFLPCGTQPLNRKRSRLLRIGVATDMAEFGTLGLLLLVSLGVQDGFQVLVKKLELKPW